MLVFCMSGTEDQGKIGSRARMPAERRMAFMSVYMEFLCVSRVGQLRQMWVSSPMGWAGSGPSNPQVCMCGRQSVQERWVYIVRVKELVYFACFFLCVGKCAGIWLICALMCRRVRAV
jgi:hypothetical protein